MESAIIDALLPLLRRVADDLASTPAADEALLDVRNAEAIVARHVAAAEADFLSLFEGRLHPAVAQPVG